jgi:hypothetical protein
MTLDERFWPKVDKSGECWEWKAGRTAVGYGQICINNKMVLAHRVSYSMVHGPIPKGYDIDHICINRGCVNPAHLRLATRKQNMENRSGPNANNRSSGVRGVTLDGKSGLWRAQLMHDGKGMSLGTFATIAEAEAVVSAKRLELFTHSDMDRIAS